ncbi:hypothetical protein B0A50_02226 [Salinomyces thailandicus]|uniref:5-formyltetrahydrofolate cyclo-ligase n=1 Tax=Salinomyces thailandicus TaxID=706561 RepID=A0A4U0U801_9PEZI|nr:hypothetical protein B0A50_02226 [Salinomyces thailandica]
MPRLPSPTLRLCHRLPNPSPKTPIQTMSTQQTQSPSKPALRRQIKTRLSTLSPPSVSEQSLCAQNLLITHPTYTAARSLSVYLSMPNGEARTNVLIRHALERGKEVFVPYIYALHPAPASSSNGDGDGDAGTQRGKKKKDMAMLRLGSVEEFEGLESGGWGIPCLPSEGLEKRANALGGFGPLSDRKDGDKDEGKTVDVVVAPGVAFDSSMARLGHGGGFYDRWLARACSNAKEKKPYVVGLCLAEQVVGNGEIEMGERDRRVDAVVVGDGRVLTVGDGVGPT